MNDRLRQIFSTGMDWLVGNNGASAGEGIETTITHTWPFPPWVTLLILLASAVVVVLAYWHERGPSSRWGRLLLAVPRIGLIAVVVLMMYGWTKNRYRTDLPDLVIMIDDSASMQLSDHYDDEKLRAMLTAKLQAAGLDEMTRLGLAKALLLEEKGRLIDELRRRYNLKFYLLGESARRYGDSPSQWRRWVEQLAAEQSASRLGTGLRDVIQQQRGRPTAAVVVLTDGVTTNGKSLGEVAHYARRKTIPLYVIGIGSDQPPRDVRLTDLLVDEMVFVGDLVHFDLKLVAPGYAGRKVTVRLREQDGPVLQQEVVTVTQDGLPQPVRLAYRPPRKGDFRYVVEAVPLAGEVNPDNNRQSRQVSVRDETIRVLYVQEYPSFDYKFIRMLLGRGLKRTTHGEQRSIELTTVLQEADLESAEQDAFAERVFPVNRDELFQYDVLIFGDVNPAFLSESVMTNVADFVKQRGGGLVVLSGPRHTPLAYRDSPLESLFPVELSSASIPSDQEPLKRAFVAEITPLGLASPQLQLADSAAAGIDLWRELPPLYWFLRAPDVKPVARVLLQHPTETDNTGRNLPLVSMQFVGAGKVIFVASDETYRWSRYRGGDQYYARFWVQMIRYLSRSKLLGTGRAAEMTVDRRRYRRGELVRMRVRFFDDRQAPPADDGVTVVLEREGAARRQIKLRRGAGTRGVFEGTVSNLPEGQYRAWVATPTLEGQPPSQRFGIIAPLGEQARLEVDVADLKTAARLSRGKYYELTQFDRLPGDLPRGRQVRIEALPPAPIWNSWILAALFVVLIVTEWLLRKRVGML